jgi:hypothetical protein
VLSALLTISEQFLHCNTTNGLDPLRCPMFTQFEWWLPNALNCENNRIYRREQTLLPCIQTECARCNKTVSVFPVYHMSRHEVRYWVTELINFWLCNLWAQNYCKRLQKFPPCCNKILQQLWYAGAPDNVTRVWDNSMCLVHSRLWLCHINMSCMQ